MTARYLWRGLLIVVLSVALSTNAAAQTGFKPFLSTGAIVGVIVGFAAAVAIVTVVVVHEASKKRTITGCVNSGQNGLNVTDEKDGQSYALSGNTTDIKPGDRMTLHGKKIKPKDASKALVWETKSTSKDFGVCQPRA